MVMVLSAFLIGFGPAGFICAWCEQLCTSQHVLTSRLTLCRYGEDMAGLGAQRAAWNMALLQDVAADAYVGLLLRASQLLGPTHAYDALWPATNVSQPWQGLVGALYGRCHDKPLMYTLSSTLAVRGGDRTASVTSGSSSSSAANSTTGTTTWISPAACLLPDAAAAAQPQLSQALARAGVPLPGLPQPVLHMMASHMPAGVRPPTVSPAIARQALRGLGVGGQREVLGAHTDAPALLGYVLSDVRLDDDGTAAVHALSGLAVLPLLDGSLGAVQPKHGGVLPGPGQVYFMPSELELQLLGSQGAERLRAVSRVTGCCMG